jgi:NAD(P)-dependent dehydrogenase (short-subunit alcohol dehydrogenase family)
MRIEGKIVVVTGAAGGIGRAMALQFARERARLVVCADLDGEGAQRTARESGGVGYRVDVASEADLAALIEATERDHGPIDLFCSNAGIFEPGGAEVADESWHRIWEVKLMSQVYAARLLVPRMAARGGGYLLNTASAAGLLSQIGSAPYAVTKHAAVGLAEWLALSHGDQGIRVSVLCPQAVRTAMTASLADGSVEGVAALDGMLEPEAVAEAVVKGLEAEDFLILPHPEVLQYMRNKSADYNRWIGGMRKLNRRFKT